MPWRHTDTDVRDDFPTNYNEGDAERLAEHFIILRLPPRHLYVCRLTTTFRHPKLSYSIKDPTGQVLTMDDFLKLPVWNGIVVSKGDPILDNQCPPSYYATFGSGEIDSREKSNLEKRGGFGRSLEEKAAPKPHHETTKSSPKNAEDTVATGSRVKDTTEHIVDLSDNTHDPIPHVNNVQPSAHVEHGDPQENVVFSDEDDEDVAAHQFIPGWGLRDDLRIYSNGACKELVSHLATPVEDEFLSACPMSRWDYVDLCNHSNTQLEEIHHLRSNLQREMQANDGLSKKLALLESVHSNFLDRERELMDRLKDVEKERDDWRQTDSKQVEMIKKLEETI
ncbi:hypothetical protein Tco_1378089 [Tanacetum coccineum]